MTVKKAPWPYSGTAMMATLAKRVRCLQTSVPSINAIITALRENWRRRGTLELHFMDLVMDLRVDIRPLEAATSLVRSVGTGSSIADDVDGTGCSGKFTCILWHTSNACPTVRTILIAWLYNIKETKLLII